MYSMRVEMSATGELLQKWNSLMTRIRGTVLRNAVTKALQPVKEMAERELFVERFQLEPRSGISGQYNLEHLYTTIITKTKVYQKPFATTCVGIVGSAGSHRAVHAHLVEWGTKKRKTLAGLNRGIMPRLPYMARAWKANKHTMLRIIEEEVAAGINREASKTT